MATSAISYIHDLSLSFEIFFCGVTFSEEKSISHLISKIFLRILLAELLHFDTTLTPFWSITTNIIWSLGLLFEGWTIAYILAWFPDCSDDYDDKKDKTLDKCLKCPFPIFSILQGFFAFGGLLIILSRCYFFKKILTPPESRKVIFETIIENIKQIYQ